MDTQVRGGSDEEILDRCKTEACKSRGVSITTNIGPSFSSSREATPRSGKEHENLDVKACRPAFKTCTAGVPIMVQQKQV